jgi:hypothetical protein
VGGGRRTDFLATAKHSQEALIRERLSSGRGKQPDHREEELEWLAEQEPMKRKTPVPQTLPDLTVQ